MKKIGFILLLFLKVLLAETYAQNIGINTTGATPNASALLDIDAAPGNSKGLLIPRLTTAQMNAIASPATGLIIYNTDCNSINYYNGTTWIALGNTGSVSTPGAITGSTTPCQNATGIAYSIAAVTGATGYNWTVPTGATVATGQGTTAITVNFGTTDGNVCVTAYNACGSSNASCTAISLQIAPAAPTATAASNIAQTSFDANWNASTGATTYYLDVATDAGFTAFVTGYNNLNVGNVTTYAVTGLTCATAYYYRVRASNSCGTSTNSNTITVTTSSCCTVDFEEHFTYATQAAADAVWPTTDPTTYRVDIGNGDLHINSFLSSTITSTSHDLGAGNVSNTQWLLRMKVTTISWVCYSSGGWADHPGMGITDRDYNSGANYNGPAQDGIGAGQSTNPCAWGHGTMYGDNSCCVFTSCCNTALNITPSGTRYLEIVRLSATSMKVTWYSDATYTTVVGTATETGVPATIQNLRYIKFSDDGGPTFGSGSGSWDYRVDDIYFWNNRITPCP